MTDNKFELANMSELQEPIALITRFGEQTVLTQKIMLRSVSILEDRTNKTFSRAEREYYRQLEYKYGVDYTTGLVAEFTVKDFMILLGKRQGGTFYRQLEELFDPTSDNNLVSQSNLLYRDSDSHTYAAIALIIGCYYSKTDKRLLIKFNPEKSVYNLLMNAKKISIPYAVYRARHSYTLRLIENLHKEIMEQDAKNGGPQEEYEVRYYLPELQLLLSAVNPAISPLAKKSIIENEDLSIVLKKLNNEYPFSQYSYKNFRKKTLEIAVNEINSTDECYFTASFETSMEKGRVVEVIFTLLRKDYLEERWNEYAETESVNVSEEDKYKAIFSLSREMQEYDFVELMEIAKIGRYDVENIVNAYKVYNSMISTEKTFKEWLRSICS